jgi:hypothetical protein
MGPHGALFMATGATVVGPPPPEQEAVASKIITASVDGLVITIMTIISFRR